MGNIGIPELILILVLVLILFGPQKLPELSRNLGKALAEFRRATADLRGSFDQHMRDLEREARELEERKSQSSPSAQAAPAPDPSNPTPPVPVIVPAEGAVPAGSGSSAPAPSAPGEVAPDSKPSSHDRIQPA